jgi:hypothetical protein
MKPRKLCFKKEINEIKNREQDVIWKVSRGKESNKSWKQMVP